MRRKRVRMHCTRKPTIQGHLNEKVENLISFFFFLLKNWEHAANAWSNYGRQYIAIHSNGSQSTHLYNSDSAFDNKG